jgi:preprotein translocase subunit SecE
VSSTAVAESAGLKGWLSGAAEFLKAVRSELGKVTWPTRTELINATRMIVVLSILLGLVIGWMDVLLNLILVDGVAALSR